MKLVKTDCSCFFYFVFDNATEADTVTVFLLPISDFLLIALFQEVTTKKLQ